VQDVDDPEAGAPEDETEADAAADAVHTSRAAEDAATAAARQAAADAVAARSAADAAERAAQAAQGDAAKQADAAERAARATPGAGGTGRADPQHPHTVTPEPTPEPLSLVVAPVPDELLHPVAAVRTAVGQGKAAIQAAGQVAVSVVVGPTLTDTPPPPPPARTVRRLRRESWAFAAGAFLFFVGTVLSLWPGLPAGQVAGDLVYVVGALFFTTGAFIQLDVSGRRPPTRATNRADRADWWSAAVQFVGTLCFNVSTAMALGVAMTASASAADGWRPDALGSALFLASGFLAVIATSQRRHLWDPLARTWRSTWLNMLGSIAFGVSAALSFPAAFAGLRAFDLPDAGLWAGVGTALGAVGFFFGAVLARRTVRLPGPAQR